LVHLCLDFVSMNGPPMALKIGIQVKARDAARY
jgi:hypothetical protein